MIKSLKCQTSYGYDGIPMKILKVSTPFITSPLTYISKKSLSSGIFPSGLKFSEIKSLRKKGDRMDITYLFTNILLKDSGKSYVYTRLYQHINQNNILGNEQYGFINNFSTERISFKLINEILLTLKNKLIVGGMFCDLEKAFDSINLDILLSKC